MKSKEKEIFSSCCAFGDGCEEVHVLRTDCPINREEGSRSIEYRGEIRNECTCIYMSIFDGGTPACKYYQGCKKVTRNKEEKYKVLCSALSE